MLTLDRIYQAAHVLKPVARKTDMILAKNIKADCAELYLKTENLQNTGSFKLRGAYFKIASLTDEQRAKGVIACSAGNHAQGVALASQAMGIKATIFIPSVAPLSKIEATRSYGANVVLVDGVYDDAYAASCEYQKETDGIFIHPFDDEDVIAGQGTIGLEIFEQLPIVDAIVTPIGGGGLISGVAYVAKMLNPKCKVYGVQASGAGSMKTSVDNHEIQNLASVSTFADGIAVKKPGAVTYDMCCKYVDEIITVTDDEIATAILTLMEQQKLVAEGAGAVPIAGILSGKLPIKDKTVCALVSGGNIDVTILSRVITRGLLTTGRQAELRIKMLDKPGQLKEVSAIIADLGANVIQVVHNFGGENTNINGCFLNVTVETRNMEHLIELKKVITDAGYKITEEK